MIVYPGFMVLQQLKKYQDITGTIFTSNRYDPSQTRLDAMLV